MTSQSPVPVHVTSELIVEKMNSMSPETVLVSVSNQKAATSPFTPTRPL